jgi:curved DNA-binding protein CbpA
MHVAGPAQPGAGSSGLSESALAEIERFLALVGQSSLFAYYDIDADTPADAVERAISARRKWAQGQQANPKYRPEALFIIKQGALLRRALVEQPDAYRRHMLAAERSRSLESLDQFLLGILAGGVLAAEAEDAVRQRGRALSLAPELVQARIDQKLRETGARRIGAAPSLPPQPTWSDDDADSLAPAPVAAPAGPPPPDFLDHYETLDVSPDADLPTLEAALRARYRWARTLKDPAQAGPVYDGLDEAWRVLRDPDRRARYDAQRREALARGAAAAPPSTADDVDRPTDPGFSLDDARPTDPGVGAAAPPQLPPADRGHVAAPAPAAPRMDPFAPLDGDDGELPTTIAPRPELDTGPVAPADPGPATPAEVVDRTSDTRDLLLGPPSYAAEVTADDLLLGPPPEAGASSRTHPRLSGARARLSGSHRAPSGARARPSGSFGSGAGPTISASGAQRASASGMGPVPSPASHSGAAPTVLPSGAHSAPGTPTWSGAEASLSEPSAARRSLPPVDTLGGQESTRAEPVAAEYRPSQSWILALAGALVVVAVYAVMAMVFGWGRPGEHRAAEPDAPLRAAAEAEATPAVAAPVAPAPEDPSPEVEEPAPDGAGDVAPAAAPVEPAPAGGGAAAPAPAPAPAAAPAAPRPIVAPPPAVAPPPEPEGSAAEDAPPPPEEPEAEAEAEAEAPAGYMGVPDF